MVKATINSEKHIVQYPIDEIPAGTRIFVDLVAAEESPLAAQDVRVGAQVKAVFVELWLVGADQSTGSTIVTIEKIGNGQNGIGFAAMADLNGYPNKKNIFFTSEGLLADGNGSPTPILRQWLPIPKGKQRFGLGDKLVMAISSQAANIDRCGMSIFKEYY